MPHPYGAPLHCPKCPTKTYYGVLKLQGGPKMLRCPNCNTLLINVGKRQRLGPDIESAIRTLDALQITE